MRLTKAVTAALAMLAMSAPALAQEAVQGVQPAEPVVTEKAAGAPPPQGPARAVVRHQLVLTGVGRFAVFADMASRTPDGDGVRLRAFQVTEADFHVGDQAYWGGWSWWRFDCAAKTADRQDFAAVREGGGEGMATPDTSPPYDATPGGDAAELLTVACEPETAGEIDADNLAAAVRIGRDALAF